MREEERHRLPPVMRHLWPGHQGELELGLPVRFVDHATVAELFDARLRVRAELRRAGRLKHGRVVPPAKKVHSP